ncbi:EAL domain-containing protein [Novilysobacter erysipheiresistens]|uniref:EAL domain-containing protein n=1 Tax=Novilysobacter erysipheiresistens TaxID=1749332 RepID=A0ABU7YVY5_9GAMM
MLVLATCFVAAWAVAGSTPTPAPAPAVASQTLVVGGDRDYPPFQFLDDDGAAKGFDVELIRAVLEPQGLSLRFELGEWDTALERLDRGEIDVVPMFISSERAERFLFSKPYMLRYHIVFGHRGSPLVESLQQLAGHRVAVQRAGLAFEALSALPPGTVELVEVDVESDALAAVGRGDAEYALVPTGIGLYATAQAGMTDIIALGPPLLERQYVFAVPRDRPELVPIIDAGLDRVRANGEQERLYQAAIHPPLADETGSRWTIPLMVVSGLSLGLLVPAFVWWRRSSAGARVAARKQFTAGAYSQPLLAADPQHQALLSDLREAIATRQLGYALQPTLDLDSRRWTGAELLVRWHHPQYGPLAPAAFVPLAERAGMIGEMTLYMVDRALELCRAWRDQGRLLTIAVNVSANDLADPALVAAIIAATGDLGPHLLLELTETDVMRDPDKVVDALAQLRPCGIRISIDDFGTGHSSLTNLRLLDADELKIDRTFVMRLLQSPSDQAIVRGTIRLAHDLGVQVTAEGIEDDATLAWLADAGCDSAQGFALAHPMSPEAFVLLLERNAGPGQARELH